MRIGRLGSRKVTSAKGDWIVGPRWGGGGVSLLGLWERKRAKRRKRDTLEDSLDGIDLATDLAPRGNSGSGGGGGFLDGFDLDFGDEFAIVLLVIIVPLIVIGLLFGLVIPVVAIALEIVVVVLLGLIGASLRLFFGRPWTLEAKSLTTGKKHTWQVKGYRNMKAKQQEIEKEIQGNMLKS